MRQLVGGCLIAAGILIAGVTGLCAMMFLGSAMSLRSFLEGVFSAGIPFTIGVGLIIAGRALTQSSQGYRD